MEIEKFNNFIIIMLRNENNILWQLFRKKLNLETISFCPKWAQFSDKKYE